MTSFNPSPKSLPAQYPVLALPSNIDYTSLDFNSLVQSLLEYAPQAMPGWDPSASEGDFGVVMLELMAYVGDIISYYGGRIAQEAYIPTATQRISLLNIAQLLDYTPYGPIPATGTVTVATFPGGPAVTVPAGTQLSTSITPDGLTEPPIYETDEEVTVPSNGGAALLSVTQGITYPMQQIAVSDGTPGQAYSLPYVDIETDSTLQVWVQGPNPDAPVLWTKIDRLIDASGDSEVYTVTTDDSGVTWITFGDNTNGVIPGSGLSIWATFRVIVGAAGNLPASTVSTVYSPVDGIAVAYQADGITPQSSAMIGGSDAEDNESIRRNAPLAFTTQQRAVSLEDFQNLAYSVPGVLMASATGQNATSVSLYIAGPGYTAPNTQLVDAVLDFFEDKTAAGTTVSVLDPAIIPIDVGTASKPVTLAVKPGYSQLLTEQNVTSAFQAVLSPPNVSFGQLLNVSDLYEAALGVSGVAYVVIPVFTREDSVQADDTSIQLRPSEFPTAGQITMNTTGGFVLWLPRRSPPSTRRMSSPGPTAWTSRTSCGRTIRTRWPQKSGR